MAVPLLMIGAVPFNLPRDSIANRRRQKIENLDPEQMMIAQMVTQAVDAVQFVLGPSTQTSSITSILTNIQTARQDDQVSAQHS